ncbi:MAG: 30S ribosomal protein S15 [bacterium]
MFDVEEKQKIINDYKIHEKDTGSSEVQVALLTERISYLTEHFKTNKKDHQSKLGLLKLVGQRRKLLKYIETKSKEKYKDLIKKLGIRK